MENDPVEEILASKKYRSLGIPPETVRDLLEKELPHYRSRKDALKVVRQKLHNIVASYLGEIDFAAAAKQLEQAARAEPAETRRVCLELLGSHLSTRERIPHLETFYQGLFQVTGQPKVLLDLACGYQPFALPWMGLPDGVRYHAYDLNHPRVELINTFFRLRGLPELAEHRDILLTPPQEEADVALFFKEAHRFEQRRHGCNLAFWKALKVRWLLVSLPASDLAGHHNMIDRQRRLVYGTLEGQTWAVRELLFENELVFCIEKEHEA